MAVYKVIQDVEAEDKLLGPLTLKGFIYAVIAVTCAYINFRLLLIGSPIKWALLPVFLIPMLLFGVLASPLGKEQPTEVWLLSRLRFFLKPRLRTWDQEGLEQHVTITVPKKLDEHLTKDLSQTEVKSRLKTLASTLDTRGWAIKNVDLNLNVAAPEDTLGVVASDRLVQDAGYAQTADVVDIHPADDIMDEQSNPTAQKFAAMMETADTERKQQVKATMANLLRDNHEAPANPLTKRLAKARASFSKEHAKGKKNSKHKLATAAKIEAPALPKPAAAKAPAPNPTAAPVTPVTPERQAVNMELAQSGSAFSVATLSQLANRQPEIEQTGPNEVTISLH
jgi:hypothetical protein